MEDKKELISQFVLEMRRGTIVLGTLSQLSKPQYGYSLVQNLCDKGLEIDSGTLYPLLRRLEKQNILVSEWETEGSKPRKYYKRTDFGTEIYKELLNQWELMQTSIHGMLQNDEV
jgi:PadR family transcriptional regulator, regulatory protein PadR